MNSKKEQSRKWRRAMLARGVVVCLSLGVSAQSTIVVDPLGGGDFDDLQAAIDVAVEGDTIRVVNGETYFNWHTRIVVDKSLVIVGDPFIGWGDSIQTCTLPYATFHPLVIDARNQDLTLINVQLVGGSWCPYPTFTASTLTLIDCIFDVQSDLFTDAIFPSSVINAETVNLNNSVVIGGHSISANSFDAMPDASPAISAVIVRLKNSTVRGGNGPTNNFFQFPVPLPQLPYGGQAAPGIQATTVYHDFQSQVHGGNGGCLIVPFPPFTQGPCNPDAQPIEASEVIYTPFSSGMIEFGSGCTGSAGTPRLSRSFGVGPPRVGDGFSMTLSDIPDSPLAASFGLLGYSRDQAGPFPLPFDLGLIGMPGCELLVNPGKTIPLLNTGGTATWTINIPNDWTLAGLNFFVQAGVRDDGVNALGLTVSNALEVWVGL